VLVGLQRTQAVLGVVLQTTTDELLGFSCYAVAFRALRRELDFQCVQDHSFPQQLILSQTLAERLTAVE
jgi:hypothetical protein